MESMGTLADILPSRVPIDQTSKDSRRKLGHLLQAGQKLTSTPIRAPKTDPTIVKDTIHKHNTARRGFIFDQV
jgi:hypothetical protein